VIIVVGGPLIELFNAVLQNVPFPLVLLHLSPDGFLLKVLYPEHNMLILEAWKERQSSKSDPLPAVMCRGETSQLTITSS
jgi:hypothetical protein